jgi:hypothetical protein
MASTVSLKPAVGIVLAEPYNEQDSTMNCLHREQKMFTRLDNAMFLFEVAEFLETEKPFESDPANREQRRNPEGKRSQKFQRTNIYHARHQFTGPLA